MPTSRPRERRPGEPAQAGALRSATATYSDTVRSRAPCPIQSNNGRRTRSPARGAGYAAFALSAREPWMCPTRTWTQSIRTAASLSLDVPILPAAGPPLHQRIARKARQLQQLGLTNAAMATRLEIDDKTVAKALRWLDELP